MDFDNCDEEKLVHQIFKEEKLEEFYNPLREELQVYLLEHFQYVKEEDLERIGISKPAARRLLDKIRERRKSIKLNSVINRILNPLKPLVQRNASERQEKSNSLSSKYYFIPEEEIQMVTQLGVGSFGVVWKAKWSSPDMRKEVFVAAKVLKQELTTTESSLIADFFKEVQSMLNLNHPNLIRLFGIVFSPPKMMIITELAESGSLRDRIRKDSGHTSIALLHDYAIQIASGMAYLESKRLIHRDLAARNILLVSKRRIKIGDFGLVRALSSEETYYVMNESKKVPFPWCAPESLRNRQFSSMSDVWMFGVTLWEMFSFGDEPWKNLNGSQVLYKIEKDKERLEKPDACSSTLYNMLLRCWDATPTERPNFTELKSFLMERKPIQLVGERFFDGTDSTLPDSRLGANASHLFAQKKPLLIQAGDKIEVIEEVPEFYLWKGQNQRSFEIGYFPLCIAKETNRSSKKKYISRPLRGSLIHAAHGGIGGTWGDPSTIDKMYLENPMHPPDILGFIDKELPPLPSKEREKHKISMNISDISPGRKVTKQFAYNRFKNEDKEALIKGPSYEGFKRSRKSKEKNFHQNAVKRSLSCMQLKDQGLKCTEGLLIDLSDEQVVQERTAADLMNKEHAALTSAAHNFPEKFGEDVDILTRPYSNVEHTNQESRYYSAPNEEEISDADSESSFSDTEWAQRAIPSDASDVYSVVSQYQRRFSQPNLLSDKPLSPSYDPDSDPFNTSFVDRYTSAYTSKNLGTIENKLDQISLSSQSETLTNKNHPSESSSKPSKPSKPSKLDVNFMKELEAKIFVNLGTGVPSFKPSSNDIYTYKTDAPLLSELEQSKKLIPPPTAHVKPFFSSNKGPAPPPPAPPPLPSFPAFSFFPFSGPSAPSREVIYGLGSTGPTPDLNIKVDKLLENVKGASREDCIRALLKHHMDVVSAMKELKIDELMRLGIADLERCTKCLQESNWDLDLAAAKCFE